MKLPGEKWDRLDYGNSLKSLVSNTLWIHPRTVACIKDHIQTFQIAQSLSESSSNIIAAKRPPAPPPPDFFEVFVVVFVCPPTVSREIGLENDDDDVFVVQAFAPPVDRFDVAEVVDFFVLPTLPFPP